MNAAIAVIAGLVVGVIIGNITEYYTSADYKPVQGIGEQSETGAATTIISGIAVGMKSTAFPMLLICVGIFVSYQLQDFTESLLQQLVCFPQQESQLPLTRMDPSLTMPVVLQKCQD